jgi:hypothetical protein
MVLAAMTIAAVSQALATRAALACSTGPDFNPVRESDLIVEGRIAGYEATSDVAEYNFLPVEVSVVIERTLKGNASGTIAIVDDSSLAAPRPGLTESPRWEGSSGACGAFDLDPTGKWIVMGLSIAEDGTYSSSRILTFYLGNGPTGEEYQQALSRLASFEEAAGLPVTGSAAPSSRSATAVGVFLSAVAVLAGLSMFAVAADRYRKRRSA